MIVNRILERKARDIRQHPCTSNRASEIGHPCDRRLFFLRTRWEEAALPSPELQLIFDLGQRIEDMAIRDLEDAGFQCWERNRDYEWQRFQLTAHLDCKVVCDERLYAEAPPEIQTHLTIGRGIPTEIKSMSPFAFQRLRTVQDMLASDRVYHQKYPAQLSVYTVMSNEPVGLFLTKNKVSGQYREIWMPLDWEYTEGLLQKAERVNAAVATNTTPPPLPWTDEICGRCEFAHICGQEVKRTPMEIIVDEDTENLLKRRDELKTAAREYKQVDALVKAMFEGKEKLIVGDYLVTGKEVCRRAYAVEAGTYWRVSIDKLAIAPPEVEEG